VPFLQVAEHGNDLGLHGNGQCRYGLAQDHQLRSQGQGTGDGYLLALTSGKLQRAAAGELGRKLRGFADPIPGNRFGVTRRRSVK
jgi:hypothetical protein